MKNVWIMKIEDYIVGVFSNKAKAINEFADIKEKYSNYKTIRVDETNDLFSVQFSYTSAGLPWYTVCNIERWEVDKNTL